MTRVVAINKVRKVTDTLPYTIYIDILPFWLADDRMTDAEERIEKIKRIEASPDTITYWLIREKLINEAKHFLELAELELDKATKELYLKEHKLREKLGPEADVYIEVLETLNEKLTYLRRALAEIERNMP